ncbi:hypothetical protein HanXRQr2_Chr06g0267801 [Helianthus annuus]|uniref:Uncharacterized protein n=1 Tax=Helianthus annuus TaxID=4232 RepID=A0A9K3NKU5_HELAN|nr:hypothetical protein HanXRQr2_Chr06g0267801 [Helianthus annuus]
MQSRRSVNRCSGTRLLILSLQPLMHWTRECCRECVCCGERLMGDVSGILGKDIMWLYSSLFTFSTFWFQQCFF